MNNNSISNSSSVYLQSTIAMTDTLRSLFTFLVLRGPTKHIQTFDKTEFQLESIKLLLRNTKQACTHANTDTVNVMPMELDLHVLGDFDLFIAEMESHKKYIQKQIKVHQYDNCYRSFEKLFVGYLFMLEETLLNIGNEAAQNLIKSIIPIVERLSEDVLYTFDGEIEEEDAALQVAA